MEVGAGSAKISLVAFASIIVTPGALDHSLLGFAFMIVVVGLELQAVHGFSMIIRNREALLGMLPAWIVLGGSTLKLFVNTD